MSVVIPSETATNGTSIPWKGDFSKKLTESSVTHFDGQEQSVR